MSKQCPKCGEWLAYRGAACRTCQELDDLAQASLTMMRVQADFETRHARQLAWAPWVTVVLTLVLLSFVWWL